MIAIHRLFHRGYGASPLHLLATLAVIAFAAFVFTRVADEAEPLTWAIWFAGAAVAHDFVLLPLYSVIDRLTVRFARANERDAPAERLRALAHVRIPLAASGLLFLVWSPGILGLNADEVREITGIEAADWLGRWLIFSASAFALSAIALMVRIRLGRSR